MNVGFHIPIHQQSEKYIKETLSQYKEVESLHTIENPIIHMYAKEDTRNIKTGELNGYSDSLFCEYYFYDTKNGTCFKSKRKHDAMYFGDGVAISNVKIFKDGSTLIHVSQGKYELLMGQAPHLHLA